MVRVWDPFVRVFHWALAASFALAWLTAEDGERLHTTAGYLAGGLVIMRVVWGFIGPRYARFAQFVRLPAATIAYLRATAGGNEQRFLGHNPAGGAMIVVLLVAIAATSASGWLLTTDALWGSAAMQRAHSVLAHALVALVVMHVAGVVLASRRHHENLVRAMVVGKKRAASPGDVA